MRGDLRQYSKSELIKVVELATRKQYVAELAFKGAVRKLRAAVAVAAAISGTLGGALVWWFLR